MSRFSERLVYYRDRAGMKQKTLAERVELDIGHLNRIEKGKRQPPRLKYIQRMIEVLHLKPEEANELLQLAHVEDGHTPRIATLPDELSPDERKEVIRARRTSTTNSTSKEAGISKRGGFDFSAPVTAPEDHLKMEEVLRYLLVFADDLRDEEEQLQQRLIRVKELQAIVEKLITERGG